MQTRLVIPDAAVAAATFNGSAPPANLDSTRAVSERRLANVHPGLASPGRAMLEGCAPAGLAIMVTEGLRTGAEQGALYARGRTVPPIGKLYRVTRVKSGQRFREFGPSIGIVVV